MEFPRCIQNIIDDYNPKYKIAYDRTIGLLDKMVEHNLQRWLNGSWEVFKRSHGRFQGRPTVEIFLSIEKYTESF